jgi:hypothetical protein
LNKSFGPFISKAWVDGALTWRENNDIMGAYHPMHHEQFFD